MTLKEFVGKNGKEKCVSKMRQWQSVTIGFINADGKDDETEFDVYRVDTSAGLEELAQLFTDFCSKCDAGCTASVADKTSEAGRYMVFTDSPYVRDAQIYCGTIDEDEDIYSEENEDNWYDTSGPVLLIDRDFKTLDELRKTVMDFYPDMDLCTLRVIRVSAETVCL